VLQRLELGEHDLRGRGGAAGGHQRAGAAVAERVGQLVAGVAGVERHRDQPGAQAPK
jgi:hypothetical protein